MSEFLDRLLKAELPNVMKDLPTKRFSIPRLAELTGGEAVVELARPVRRPAPGQSAVFYDGNTVIGGGEIIDFS